MISLHSYLSSQFICFKKYFSSSFSLLVLNSIGYSFISDFKPSDSWDFLIYGMIWEFAWGLLSYFERLGYSVHLLCDISLIAFPLHLGYHLIFIFSMIFLHQIQSNSCEDFLNVFSCEGTERDHGGFPNLRAWGFLYSDNVKHSSSHSVPPCLTLQAKPDSGQLWLRYFSRLIRFPRPSCLKLCSCFKLYFTAIK